MVALNRLLLAASLLAVGASEALADYYGAIAYSAANRSASYSYDYPSRSAAEANALQRCSESASDCSVVLWFRNACGALAVGPNGTGHAWAGGRTAAEREALRYCSEYSEGCQVTTWVCTTR